jgi:acetyl esterase/lipase/glyoxylase-like metal-dependent hydrolase (beta-lactamase superfamily II)
VLNTHAHFDHSMADGLFRNLGARILVGSDDADAVEKGTRVTANFLLDPKLRATYPRTTVDWRLSDGEELRLGNKILHVIHTPGHTAGSTSFMLQLDGRNILFSGDTLLYDYRLGAQGTAYADNRAYVASLQKIAKFTLTLSDPIHWDMLLSGHGALVLDRAYMDVDKGWRTVQLDLLEGQPIAALPFSTDSYRKLMFGRPPLEGKSSARQDSPPQPPLPDTVGPQTKAVLAPILAQPAASAESDVPTMRAFADKVQAMVSEHQLSRYKVRVETGKMAGIPVRIFTPENAAAGKSDVVLLNLHGGGFVVDSGSLTENIPVAALTGMTVIAVLYRLAPEHPFPAAVEDAVRVYRELLKTHSPHHIVLYGTSAGATLSAEALVRLKALKVPLPAALGFFSAPTDLQGKSDSEQYLPKVSGKDLSEVFKPYLSGADPNSPELSPLHADLTGFPPTLLLTGTRDQLLSQTALFQRALLRAGVEAQLVVFEAMPHAHWTWLEIAESDEAFELMARFFRSHLQ